MPAHNPFKTALATGQPRIGLWLSMADPYLAEAAATCGYDWLLIDGEHAPNDVRSTLAALQAVAPHPAQAVVRVVEGRSEEHTSELQSQSNLVCRLLLEKKKKKKPAPSCQASNAVIPPRPRHP